jgi:hypothetical protein
MQTPGTQFKEHKGYCLSVKIDSVREMYQAAIGAHPEQSQSIEPA